MSVESHIVLHIVGMRGEEDALTLAEHLLGVEGVDDASVDFEAHTADVVFNEQEPATVDAVTRAVQDAGLQIESIDKPVFGADVAG